MTCVQMDGFSKQVYAAWEEVQQRKQLAINEFLCKVQTESAAVGQDNKPRLTIAKMIRAKEILAKAEAETLAQNPNAITDAMNRMFDKIISNQSKE